MLLRLSIFGLLICNIGHTQELPIIKSTVIQETDSRYQPSLEKYQQDETWRLWSFSFLQVNPNDDKSETMQSQYRYMGDEDLTTAWFASDSTNNDTIQFPVKFWEVGFYGTAYQFKGVINIFNGQCKSRLDWNNYSRIRTLKVYLNETAICTIELLDTWNLQTIDISPFFKNQLVPSTSKAPYQIKNGDVFRFEIVDVFIGNKFKTAAISEFLYRGASN